MSTAVTAEYQQHVQATADERQVALPFRGDTFLGVFEAIGQDLGFNPNWIRIPFAALILWNPGVIAASYLGLGCVVALSRWLYPVSGASKNEAAAVSADAPVTRIEDGQSQKELLAA